MKKDTTLEDIIGLEYTKLGFFGEVKKNMAKLEASNIKLARKQRKLEAVFEGISDVMIILSTNFIILSVNRLFTDMFHIKNPRGRYCYEILKKRDMPCPDCPVIPARETNRVCREMISYDIGDDHYQFDITVSPLRDPRHRVFRFLVLMRDVTREKQYQVKYHYSKKMATVGALAAGVAHEINNPLTAISGFTKGLKRRIPRLEAAMAESSNTTENRELLDDFTEYIDTILAECDRCRDIVQGLLTFSPRKKVDFTPLNFKRLVIAVLKLLRYRFKQNPRVTISFEANKGLHLINGNAPELKQVVLNLVCNALDAVNENGTINLSMKAEQDKLMLSIQDDGCGIDPGHMDRLFDPFFTTKPIGQGIGIGLSTCYNIVQQHQGEILVKSDTGQGTCFTIVLPRTPQEQHP